MTDTAALPLMLLRIGVAGLLIVHGIARAWLGIVDDFGTGLGIWGFPAGLALAWSITVLEIVGGAALAVGYFVRPLAAWFAFQLLMGIYFVHAPAGWFVVGAGRTGMEYSVLLILCLLVIAIGTPYRARRTPVRLNEHFSQRTAQRDRGSQRPQRLPDRARAGE